MSRHLSKLLSSWDVSVKLPDGYVVPGEGEAWDPSQSLAGSVVTVSSMHFTRGDTHNVWHVTSKDKTCRVAFDYCNVLLNFVVDLFACGMVRSSAGGPVAPVTIDPFFIGPAGSDDRGGVRLDSMTRREVVYGPGAVPADRPSRGPSMADLDDAVNGIKFRAMADLAAESFKGPELLEHGLSLLEKLLTKNRQYNGAYFRDETAVATKGVSSKTRVRCRIDEKLARLGNVKADNDGEDTVFDLFGLFTILHYLEHRDG